MRKWICPLALLLAALTFTFYPGKALAAPPNLTAASALLLDTQSGTVLYSKEPDLKWYPASVTKIMTLVLALEAVADGRCSLDDQVTTSAYAASMGGSQVYLEEGETRTLDEMLIAVAVGSGNDAAVAVGEFLAGDNQSFVDMMNAKAEKLGMKNTHFANAHGLHDDNHYTTAQDLGILALHALKVPHLLEYTSIYEYQFRPDPKPLILWNTNRLLKWYDGADGLKTGYTDIAKRNIVATANKDGFRLIAIVLGAPQAGDHFTQSMQLLNYGYNEFAFTKLHNVGDPLCRINLKKGTQRSVGAVAASDVGVVRPKSQKEELGTRVRISEKPEAPISAGQKLGEVEIYGTDGATIAKVDLLADTDIAKLSVLAQWQRMLGDILSLT